jgi:putative endonuclease
MFYVYIIESESSRKWYFGYTEQLESRLKYHNTNHNHYTGGKGPWRYIFQRPFIEKTDALLFEKKLKRLGNKEYVKREYAEYFLEI